MSSFVWSTLHTGFGKIFAASTDKGLCKLSLPGETREDFFGWIERHAGGAALVENGRAHRHLQDQLDRYLGHRLVSFDVPIDLLGTEFQRTVWTSLQKIPYGTTITYAQLALRVGRPKGAQSVGRANGANPVPIVVPCHRVIGSDNSLIGYGGGIKMKEFLLRLEGAILV